MSAGGAPGRPAGAFGIDDTTCRFGAEHLARLLDDLPQSGAAPDFAVRGALVYQAGHCAACHMVNGVGMKVGPPLNGLAKRQTRSWVDEHFANPRRLSPGSIMPPYQLNSEDKKNLTAYLFSLPE